MFPKTVTNASKMAHVEYKRGLGLTNFDFQITVRAPADLHI